MRTSGSSTPICGPMSEDLTPVGGAGPYCADCGHTTLHSARDCVHQACAACRAGAPILPPDSR